MENKYRWNIVKHAATQQFHNLLRKILSGRRARAEMKEKTYFNNDLNYGLNSNSVFKFSKHFSLKVDTAQVKLEYLFVYIINGLYHHHII